MANKQKKIEKLNQHILELERDRRDALSGKKNGAAEINVGDVQKKIDAARKKVVELHSAK